VTGPAARTVLIVDDERLVEELLAALLEDGGYAVRRAYDGEAALRDVERARPDLVLSDVAMPGLSGIELAERLAERAVPVVLISAAVADPGLPGVPFVAKPIDLGRVLAVVGEFLER
jgi:CheY-like chemotaxis protein